MLAKIIGTLLAINFSKYIFVMIRYSNLNGSSNVFSFEIGTDSITIQFYDGSVYLYNYFSTGSANVEQMKNLARLGRGLNSFISRVIKKKYASKLR